MTNGEKFKDVFGFGADGSRVIAVNSTWWDCDFQIRKLKTNADRIRAMSDEELADWYSTNFSEKYHIVGKKSVTKIHHVKSVCSTG